ncbi:ferrochelatase [Rhodococcus triatomae]|uniref:Coproporphyrin III ferrochelatase n=1 Tax=Rhodococcus triatomae TaxID=300028 RepID=A0A1G8KAS5_9NOCA|nr:ferrochelatase [Rhodococcus triatomae]QNG18856.1 ferrochelatase [Rhodococcus triatomae]QNG25232.1 ferrochelatase [Rhodococcus triatomae]SDI39950.1 ferrochelatase [Rhodococcus triatomae]
MTDALLVLSFGGPERPEDVRPFLENVTRGRGIPPERLDAVVEHYLHFGGISPINALNRDIITRLEADLAAAGLDLPVYFGNRNWHPMVEATVERMREDGVRDALVFATSAWGGYSGCRQYHEDIARAREAVGATAPHLRKLRQYYDHPLLVSAFAESVRAAAAALPNETRGGARLVFTAHSVPEAADVNAGPAAEGGRLYSRQVAEAARLVAAEAGYDDYDLVWQSRSGPPQVPWLEPDVVDHIDALAARSVPAVIVCPVGFVSDHLEVVWDLDTEAEQAARRHGIGFARAATPGTDPRFTRMILELIAERREGAPARRLGTEPLLGVGLDGSACADRCCLAVGRPVSATPAR